MGEQLHHPLSTQSLSELVIQDLLTGDMHEIGTNASSDAVILGGKYSPSYRKSP